MSYCLSVIASFIAIVLGATTLGLATEGWQVWTAESARRLAVQESPVPLPELWLETTGMPFSLTSDSQENSSLILLELIYTRCPTVCQLMGAEFASLQARIMEREEHPRVKLVSLSFDPDDDLRALVEYGERYRASDRWWTLGIPNDQLELETFQKIVGSVVLPEPTVGYIHNAAIYAIHRGSLVAILDHDNATALDKVIDQYGYVEELDLR